MMVVMSPLRNMKSYLSDRNENLLYKQFVHPMMDYACPAWTSADGTNVRRLQVLQSRCLRFATGAVSNRQIHQDQGVPLLADHIRAPTESFDTKLTEVGKPLLQQLAHSYADGR